MFLFPTIIVVITGSGGPTFLGHWSLNCYWAAKATFNIDQRVLFAFSGTSRPKLQKTGQ